MENKISIEATSDFSSLSTQIKQLDNSLGLRIENQLKSIPEDPTLRAVVAKTEGSLKGWIFVKQWAGPLPLILQKEVLSFGCLWGFWASTLSVKRLLLSAAIEYWKSLGVKKSIAMNIPQCEMGLFEEFGFNIANAMVYEGVRDFEETPNDTLPPEIEIKFVAEDCDQVVVENWFSLWNERGINKKMMIENYEGFTKEFIDSARENLHYITVAATVSSNDLLNSIKTRSKKEEIMTKCSLESDSIKPLSTVKNLGTILGTISCQLHNGTGAEFNGPRIGSVWNVYVHPEFRRYGIGTAMMKKVLKHFKDIWCSKAVLIYASEEGRRLYEKVGFKRGDMLVLDLNIEIPKTIHPIDNHLLGSKMEQGVKALRDATYENNIYIPNTFEKCKNHLLAIPPLLEAIYPIDHPCYQIIKSIQKKFAFESSIEREDNWFVNNINKLGKGFDMKKLASDPKQLAMKFSNLSKSWEGYVTGCRYDYVFKWLKTMSARILSSHPINRIVQGSQLSLSSPGNQVFNVLDLGCGIGLPGHLLRLADFEGNITGIDISENMIEKSRERQCYNNLLCYDIHEILSAKEKRLIKNNYDVLICVGTMELLNISKVLKNCSELLINGGELWVSFQWKIIGKPNPTEHQNIEGITEEEMENYFKNAGFKVLEVERCEEAFKTPIPESEGKLMSVPYLFCRVTKD